MMTGILLSGAVRAAVVLAAGLAAVALLSRAAAATRRFVLVLTLGAAVVVPFAAAVGPRWSVRAPAALSVLAHESDDAHAGASSTGDAPVDVGQAAVPHPAAASPSPWKLDLAGAAALAWLAVATTLLVRAAGAQLRGRAVVRRATPVESATWLDAAAPASGRTHVDIRASAEIDSPAVTGLLRATIVIPRDALNWPAERCRLVLVHELSHVRRLDVLAQALADVACALHWVNPLVWICARRLRIEREIAADDAVLAEGVRPSRYAEELLAVATLAPAPAATLAMAERSSLEARVTSILASSLARAPLAARGTAAVVAAGAALAAAAACTSPVTSAPPGAVAEAPVQPRGGTATDAPMQRAAEEEASALAKEWSPELVTVVVLDPATGEILANTGRIAGKPADVASTLAMPPGSTMKPITIAAALETHAISVDQQFECGPAPRKYGDEAIEDSQVHGTLDLAHLLAVSSNIGTSHVFDALGGENLASFIHRFHFGEAPGIPGAATGAVPEHIVTGSFEGAMTAIGGHEMPATPLQMIAAFGAIADDGVYHAPTLDRGGSPGERILSSDTASKVMTLLETVVTDEHGTGALARVDGVHIAGKTGTSEWTGVDGRDLTYASFIGVADLPSRRILALVGIGAAGASGPQQAAPAFARLVKHIRGS